MKTKKEIAERIGISQALFSMLYHGRRKASYQVSTRLAKVTGIDKDIWYHAKPADIKKMMHNNFGNEGGDKK